MIRKEGSIFGTTSMRKEILKFACLSIGILSMVGTLSAQRTCSDALADAYQKACTHPANSCFMRCGTTFGGKFTSASMDISDHCSCDERCNVYGDCCWDFHIQCQREFEISVTKYSHLLYLPVQCHRRLYFVISECQIETSSMLPTSPIVFQTDATISYVNTQGTLLPLTPQGDVTVLNRDERPPIEPDPTQDLAQGQTSKLQRFHGESIYVLDQTYGVVYKNETVYDCFKTPDSVKIFLPRLLVIDYTRNINMDSESRIRIDESMNLNVIDLPYRKCYLGGWITCDFPCKNKDYSLKTCERASLEYNSVHTETYSKVCYFFVNSLEPTPKLKTAEELLGTTIVLQRVGNKDEAYLLIALKEFWKILYCSNPQLHLHECQVLQCADNYLPLDARTCFKPNQVEILVGESDVANTNVLEKIENLKPALTCTCFLIFKAFQNVFLGQPNRLYSRNECTFAITHPITSAFEEAEKEEISILDILKRSVTISEINRSGIDRIQLKHLDTLSRLQKEVKLQFLIQNQCEDLHPLIHACFDIETIFYSGTAGPFLGAKEMLKRKGKNVKCFSLYRNQSNKIPSLSWLVIIIVVFIL